MHFQLTAWSSSNPSAVSSALFLYSLQYDTFLTIRVLFSYIQSWSGSLGAAVKEETAPPPPAGSRSSPLASPRDAGGRLVTIHGTLTWLVKSVMATNVFIVSSGSLAHTLS